MIRRVAPVAALIAAVAVSCTTTSLPSAQPGLTVAPSAATSIAPDSSSQPAVTIAQVPACTLVLADEVEAAVGIPIDEAQDVQGESDASSWLSDCIYWRQESQEQAPLKVTLAAGAVYLDEFAALTGADGVAAKEGLGDDALVRMVIVPGLDQPLGSLYIRLGNALLVLAFGIVGVGDDGALQLAGDGTEQTRMLTDLAGLAIARLTGHPVASPVPSPVGTPPPVNGDALTHPCALLSDAELGAILGVAIKDHAELGAGPGGINATCDYSGQSGEPLTVRLGQGAEAVQNFNLDVKGIEDWSPLSGLGDEAFSQLDPYYGATPIVVAVIRKGDVVLQLGLGAVGEDTNGDFVPPGTVEQQMAMIRKLADLMLPRIVGG